MCVFIYLERGITYIFRVIVNIRGAINAIKWLEVISYDIAIGAISSRLQYYNNSRDNNIYHEKIGPGETHCGFFL